MSRLIDADALLHVLCTSSYPQDVDIGKAYYIFKKELKNAPTVDAVSVVRCGDCKRRRSDGYCTKYQKNIDGQTTVWFMPSDDWYCADGVRKE